MTTERWHKLKKIFTDALELDESDQNEFLIKACGEDQQLLGEVKSLISAYNLQSPLDQPIDDLKSSALTEFESNKSRGRIVGPYKIIDELGRGGMGNVYLAERADGHFDQRVALKLLKTGLTSDNQIRRFLAERQILASLNHEHIARLLDGGVTDEGQPWFVMEYVDGKPIDQYCDEHQLTIHQRLELFLDVCTAVQFAHQSLIVHRDLKPSNIFVKEDGTIKLLDFGIAKALNPNDFGGGLLPVTLTGFFPLTPAYASPEQVRGKTVSTTSDIYQLGVVLYELLTGFRPYEVTGRTPSEIEQIICEEDPTRPSTAITKMPSIQKELETTPGKVSSARNTEPGQLKKHLRGDLDTIILKALRKEPERRYDSADQMAADIRHYLKGKPVTAHPDLISYRAKKFVQRHTIGVVTTIVIILLLAGYAVTITWHSQKTQAALQQAQQETKKAEQVTEFLMGMFEANDPYQFPGATITAEDLLKRGAEQAEQLQNQHEIQAQMFDLTGRIYMNLGNYDMAESLLERGLQLRREIPGTLNSLIHESMHNLGVLYWNRGQYPLAEEYLRDALKIKKEIYDSENESLATTMTALAIVLKELRNFEEAEPLYRDALAINLNLFGEVHESVAFSYNNLGNYLESVSEFQKAEDYYRRSLKIYRELYGNTHPLVAGRLNNLGNLLGNIGNQNEALAYHEEALKIRSEVFDKMHPDIAESKKNIAIVLMDLEHYEEAKEYLYEALTIQREVLDPLHPNTSQTLNTLGVLMQRMDELEAATDFFNESLEMKQAQLGANHSEVGIQLNNIGLLLIRQERYDEAMSKLEKSKEILLHNFDEDHYLLTYPLLGIAHIYLDTEKYEQAEPYLQQALTTQINAVGSDHWLTGVIKSRLGSCLMSMDKFSEAEPLLLEGYETLKIELGETHTRTQNAISKLVTLYDNRQMPKESLKYQELITESVDVN